ncbi:MAG: hypothetical protein LJE95_09800 [Acidobacteria bacterium]|jgi:hypothetical protein|nr:hypothetical protein [Acidobacteriota bacterium]
MKLIITTHFWLTKLWKAVCSWFDLEVDLADLSLDEDEVMLDLTAGRD